MENDDDFEAELERQIDARGRTRSQSFSSAHSEDYEENDDLSYSRGRSRSILSDAASENEDSEDAVARALNLSKLYLAGSTPVDPSAIAKKSSSSNRRRSSKKTGALSKKALGALNDGLVSSSTTITAAKTQAELEEAQLQEQEALELDQLRMERTRPPPPPATASSSTGGGVTSYLKSTFGKLSKRKSTNSTTKPPAAVTTTNRSNSLRDSQLGENGKRKHKLKLLLLGDSGVGKTSLIRVFSGDKFSESLLATAGVDFKLRDVEIEGEFVRLQVWDTAGQERFHRITSTYYKGADGIVLVYDVNDTRGFENVGYWMNNIQQYSSPKIPAMLLVGNKIDLPSRVVSTAEGKETAERYNCRFLETSAKTSENVEDALMTITGDSLYLSFNKNMTQAELLEREKKYGKRGLKNDNCLIS